MVWGVFDFRESRTRISRINKINRNHMKHKIAPLLGLLLFLAGVTNATEAIYRWRFQPNTSNPCWASGTYDGSSIPQNYPPITIHDGDVFIMSILPGGSCCSANSQTVANTWEEASYDGGTTWSFLSPTYLPVSLSPITSSEKWVFGFDGNGNLTKTPYFLTGCNPGGGN